MHSIPWKGLFWAVVLWDLIAKCCARRKNERGGGSSGAACFPKIKEDEEQHSARPVQAGESHWDNYENYCGGGILLNVKGDELGACNGFLCIFEFAQPCGERPLSDHNWNELVNSVCEQKANLKLQAVSLPCCMVSKEMCCILKI